MKKAFETADGRKFETLERAIIHADKMRADAPEYIWRNKVVYYVLFPDGSSDFVERLSTVERERIGLSDLFPEDFFPEVRELSPEEKAESEARTRAWRFLESQQPGQQLKVGRHKFVIWRSRGSEVFMTKAGSKGRKLFKLEVSSFHPVTFEVVEVSGGSGEKLGKPPVARFQP
jgi:hypothetical protein